MADYTITLTNEQNTALQSLVDKINTNGLASDPDYVVITVEEYVQNRASGAADSYLAQAKAEEEKSLVEAYRAADDTTKTNVKNELGV